MSNEDRPTFILCVGAQKAGTSWLHYYMENQPNTNMGCTKEYHIWDGIYPSPIQSQFKVGLGQIGLNCVWAIRYAMQNYRGFYELYFKSLIGRGAQVTGDFTPGYEVISTEAMKEVRKRIEGAGFSLRVVYILRDPVDRCWSLTRMHNQAQGITEAIHLNRSFRRIFAREEVQCYTRYEISCEKLLDAFSLDQVYFGLYENMFSEQSLRDISTFMNVGLRLDLVNTEVNKSETSVLDPEAAASCREFYRHTYDYSNERFPMTKELWRRN